jgi:hypothetical protein
MSESNGETVHTSPQRWTRRRFLAVAGSGLAAAAVPRYARADRFAGTSSLGTAPAAFRSRPDLAPAGVEVTAPAVGTAPGYVFVACQSGSGQPGPLIVDNRGEVVWFLPITDKSVLNFRAQTYRQRPVLTWWEGQVTNGYGLGEYVIMDESYHEVARVKAGNGLQGDVHEFELTTRNTALLTAYQPMPFDLSSVGGPTAGTLLESIVQEVDVASGRVLFEWHARDHVSLGESYATVANGALDHFHVNSIDVDTDGNLLVSARNTWTVYKLNRTSGAIIWRLGGKKSHFSLKSGAPFAWQHDARRQADGTITLFDDGAGPAVEPASRGIALTVDERARTARLAAEYLHDGYLAVAMGSMQRLPDGGAFVGWGTVPGFSEFTPAGKLRFDARFPGGEVSYRAYRYPWTGNPSGRPSLTVEAVNGAPTAFVSWNGATAVAHWRLRTGAATGSLRAGKTVSRTGFETQISLAQASGYVAVEALDKNGRTLATSTTVAVL